MDDLEKKCEHNLLVNSSRERIKEGDDWGKCIYCFEDVKVDDSYQADGYHYRKKDKEEIPSEINCSG